MNENTKQIELKLKKEEIESIKLVDIEKIKIKTCAKKMKMSAEEFNETLNSARTKIAKSIGKDNVIKIILEEEQIELIEYVESIDEDLADIEDDIYEEAEDDDDDDEFNYIEMECPSCNDFVEIDEDLLYDEGVDIVCPNCQSIILSADELDSDCDCYDEK